MIVFLRHLGDASAEELHLCLKIDIYRRFPSGGTLAGSIVLSIMAILGQYSRMWSEEEAIRLDRRRSQLG
ncbi:unnamed protein product [Prunus armeniaca]